MNPPVFFFGTLCHLPLLERVLGRSARVSPASLDGASAYWVADAPFPVLIDGAGQAKGVLLRDVTDADLARLDYYEGAFGYALRPVQVHTETGSVAAQTYRSDQTFETGASWSLDHWIASYGAISVEAAGEVMEGFGTVPPKTIAARFAMIRARARAVVAARATPSAPSDAGLDAGDVQVHDRRRPYTNYFSLLELTLSHARYDGTQSAPVDRAVFVATDVALVLPYDPQRDRVLLVEQFRMGPFVRGDHNPWSLEPIAGRIDTAETPEATARREAIEEAGLSLGALHDVSRSYPSPGASTEYFHSFVGIADLPDTIVGIGGLDSEDEDIRSIVVDFDDLLEMARADTLSNGPLVMLVWWLAAHRDRLRA